MKKHLVKNITKKIIKLLVKKVIKYDYLSFVKFMNI